MPKTMRNQFDDKLTFTKMLEAHYRAKDGKATKKEIILFEMDLESNISNMVNEIKNNKYQFGEYREFFVYEPKKRLIKSLPYKDRVVHQWYVEEFIKPYYFPKLIKDTFACLDGRGTHLAIKVVQKYMRRMQRKYSNYYVLKCDIKKYFYTINREILLNILKRTIKDKKVINFTKIILNSKDELGIPIGNYTSQYFANIYLNEIDHYIKDELRVKYYVRYMDDFILLLKTKEEAKILKEKINEYVKNHLNLELNSKSRYYPSKFGIDFCGYKIFETHILVRKRSKKKMNKRIKNWNYNYANGKIVENVLSSWNSWIGHTKHANSYNLINNYKAKIVGKEVYKIK